MHVGLAGREYAASGVDRRDGIEVGAQRLGQKLEPTSQRMSFVRLEDGTAVVLRAFQEPISFLTAVWFLHPNSGQLLWWRSIEHTLWLSDSYLKAISCPTAFWYQAEAVRLTRCLPLSWQLPGTG